MSLEVLKKRWVDILLWSVITVGILWRLFFYAWNASLWHDEILLALNIVERSAAELFEPLGRNQAAPLLFLLGVKGLTYVFGESDYVFRVIPLFSGCLALVWMGVYARKYLDPLVAIFACSVMAFSTSLMMYSVNLKQYSGDLLASVIALHLFAAMQQSRRGMVAACVLVALLPWFSFPSIFVIAGLTIGYAVNALLSRERDVFIRVAALAAVGTISFLIYYFLIIRHVSGNEELVNFWVHFYFWKPVWSFHNYLLLSAGIQYTTTFAYSLTIWVFAIGVVVGLLRNFKSIFPVVMVFVVTLLVVALERYPFCERLILYLFPMSAILLSQTLLLFARSMRWVVILAVVSVIAVFLNGASKNMNYLIEGPLYQDVRSSFQFVEINRTPEELVCLVPPFDEFGRFYRDFSMLADATVIEGFSEERLLSLIESGKPFWLMSEERRADQSQFLIDFVTQLNVAATSIERAEYELSYIKFKRTLIIYFTPGNQLTSPVTVENYERGMGATVN
jgi:hypothetical protein